MSEDLKGKPIRVVIADDHAMVRDGLRRLLEDAGLKVVGEASDGMTAVSLVRQLQPDVLLLDLLMPDHPGLEALSELHVTENKGSTRVIVLTADASPGQIVTALQLGASGLVMKASATQVLLTAINTVLTGGHWVGLKKVDDLPAYLKANAGTAGVKTFGLTRRELQIVSAIVSGRTNREIAGKFTLSEETVKHHLSNTYDKTGVSTRLELAMFAIKHKLPLDEMD